MNYELDLVFSCGLEENFLPDTDAWLVIDILRATTVITRWFELGGGELYPVKSPVQAKLLTLELKENGQDPLLMGEVNGIPPEGFDLGNSPIELNRKLIQKHFCGVMSTTNGTVALNEAFSTGSPVIAVSFRNLSACLEHALTLGNKIGLLCSGRKKRPSWEDTLCAGALIEKLMCLENISMSDSAKIALTVWQSRSENLLSCVEKSEHAEYLKHIGYGRDIAFACEIDSSNVVPILEKNNSNIFLKSIKGRAKIPNSQIFAHDPFEELLSYTEQIPENFLKKESEN